MKDIINKIKNVLNNELFIVMIFCFNGLIFLLHLFKVPYVLIDNTTIILMLMLILAPLASSIKRIKFGDFEAELSQEIKKVEKQAKAIKTKTEDSDVAPKKDASKNELRELAAKDPVLAFAKLRIEIELKLRKLFAPKNTIPANLRMMTQELVSDGVISNKLRSLITDTAILLNKVIHGEDIPTEESVDRVLDIGEKILGELEYIFFEKFIDPSSEKVISKKKLSEFMSSTYKVTTVVPLAEKPCMNTRILNQEQLDDFLDGYDEYAEFLVEIVKLK